MRDDSDERRRRTVRFGSVSATRVSLEATRDGYQVWRMTNLMIAATSRSKS